MQPSLLSSCACGSLLLLSGEVGNDSSTPEAPGRYGSLDPREREEDDRGEEHHAERRPEDARKPVTRLVDDDVAQAAAACDCRDRRRRDDRDGRNANSREEERDGERKLDP